MTSIANTKYLVLILCLFLQGCLSVTVLHNEKVDINDAETLQSPYGVIRPYPLDYNPDHVLVNGSEEVHIRKDIAYAGIFIIVGIVPIPLIIPVGYNELTHTYVDGKLVRVSGIHGERVIYGCGYMLGGDIMFFGCVP